MKRSEMVRIIEVQFMKRLGTHNFNTKDIAKKVLDRIEQAGMLPPLRRGEPDSLFNLTQEFIDEHDIKVNEWEPEDE